MNASSAYRRPGLAWSLRFQARHPTLCSEPGTKKVWPFFVRLVKKALPPGCARRRPGGEAEHPFIQVVRKSFAIF